MFNANPGCIHFVDEAVFPEKRRSPRVFSLRILGYQPPFSLQAAGVHVGVSRRAHHLRILQRVEIHGLADVAAGHGARGQRVVIAGKPAKKKAKPIQLGPLFCHRHNPPPPAGWYSRCSKENNPSSKSPAQRARKNQNQGRLTNNLTAS